MESTEKTPGDNSQSSVTKKTTKAKRGLFPRLSLAKVLELPEALYKVGEGEPVRRVLVFDRLGKSADSGASRALVTASGMYDFTKGGYQATHLELTEKGKSIMTTPKGSKKFYEVVYDVLFSNEIFSGFINYWKNKTLPGDEIATDWLNRTYNLGSEDSKNAWSVIKTNLMDWELTEQLSGKTVVVDKDVAIEKNQDKSSLDEETTTDASIEKQQSLPQFESSSLPNRIVPKPFGTQILERDFTYGRARLILPEEMTTEEIGKLKGLIDGLVKEIKS